MGFEQALVIKVAMTHLNANEGIINLDMPNYVLLILLPYLLTALISIG